MICAAFLIVMLNAVAQKNMAGKLVFFKRIKILLVEVRVAQEDLPET
jgi:hypothetical protein